MVSILYAIKEGLVEGSGLDRFNLVVGILGVALMIRRSLWAFPVGMIAVTVQGVLFWQATLYAETTLQVFFFGCLGYGWWHWIHGRGDAAELPVTLLSSRERLGWIAGATVLMLVWGTWQAKFTNALVPYRDTFIASFSIAAQILQARKKLENWAGWVAVNSIAIVTYWSMGEVYWVFLYLVFWGMGISGWVAWHRAIKEQSEPAR
ncbi:nicotinamide riboside transporter PnuC [Opitutaceae bacterium]|nr:nicotinamide riboside transporter PnuC [Opitutaceae bacterium]